MSDLLDVYSKSGMYIPISTHVAHIVSQIHSK